MAIDKGRTALIILIVVLVALYRASKEGIIPLEGFWDKTFEKLGMKEMFAQLNESTGFFSSIYCPYLSPTLTKVFSLGAGESITLDPADPITDILLFFLAGDEIYVKLGRVSGPQGYTPEANVFFNGNNLGEVAPPVFATKIVKAVPAEMENPRYVEWRGNGWIIKNNMGEERSFAVVEVVPAFGTRLYRDMMSKVRENIEEVEVEFDGNEYIVAVDGLRSRIDRGGFERAVMEKEKELGIGIFAEKMPMWQCFFIFGFIPFLTLYFFFKDLLSLTFIKEKTRGMIAILGSIILVQTGAFSMFLRNLAIIAHMSIHGAFFILIILLSSISVLLSWFGTVKSYQAEMERVSTEFVYGAIQAGLGEFFKNLGKEEK